MQGRCTSVLRHPTSDLANAALPVLFEQAPGPPCMSTSLPIGASEKKSEGARDAGVAIDPRTLAPRGPKATRPRTGPARLKASSRARQLYGELPPQVRRFP